MKRFALSVFAMAFFMVFSALAQPKLEIIGGDTYDWKDVSPKDNPLKAKIKLKNTGNETLLISNVKPACGCTTAPLDKQELTPGETATLDVTLRITESSKNMTKTITISSNDPLKSQRILYLKCNVVNPLDLTPRPYFKFDNLQVGYESASALTLKNQTNKPITLSDYTISQADANVKFNMPKRKVLKPGESIELIAKVTPTKSGNFDMNIVIKTNNSEYPELKIYGRGKVKESEIFNNK